MKIRTKLILNYSIISIILLLGFSLTVLLFSIDHRNKDFKIRLQSRAKSTVKLLIDVPQIDSTLLKIIDDNTLSSMNNFSLTIYSSTSQALYSFNDSKNNSLLDSIISSKVQHSQAKSQTIAFDHIYLGKVYKVEASAIDLYGLQELRYLSNLLLLLLMATFVFIIITGIYSAHWSLKPFRRLINEIENFNFNKTRLNVVGTDEVAQLSQSFNNLLDQLLKAYNDQKAFVSQVSHELRTPITALIGQIEITLKKNRTAEEYRKVLESANEDGLKIAQVINGFLELAEANLNPDIVVMEDVRLDELLFSLASDFVKNNPEKKISVYFVQVPEDHQQLTCFGNNRLLKIMFRNFIENAIKYSENKKVEINIDYSQNQILVNIIDWGIGIAAEDMNDIFIPLFRGQNVNSKSTGTGLGLSIAQKIAELHRATIQLESKLNVGTKVQIKLPRKLS